jgi:DNA polymerase III epsilon subunit-like protein
MALFVFDVESDGPCPGLYNMISFGCVKLYTHESFLGKVKPISPLWDSSALAISGISRTTHESYPDPKTEMERFASWLKRFSGSRHIAISDNPAFDWQWLNYYCHKYLGDNPFGFSARRIGDFAAGLKSNFSDTSSWKKLRRTTHDHNPVNDALGNAEALEQLLKEIE